jgi:hypothetical protein
MANKIDLAFEATLTEDDSKLQVQVSCENRGRQEVTIVTLPRYLGVELLNRRGKFLSGSPHNVQVQMPSTKDYLSIKPQETATKLFILDVERLDTRDNLQERDYAVGHHRFDKFPAKTEIRVTYRPEKLMPNLPSSKRRSFAADPIVGKRLVVSLP